MQDGDHSVTFTVLGLFATCVVFAALLVFLPGTGIPQ